MGIKTKILCIISNLLTGNVTYHNCRIDTAFPELITIGDNFIAAPGSVITAHDASLVNKTGRQLKAPVKIGDNCYLGSNAVILPGVTIGNNVIVAAQSLVTKSFPDNVFIGGNPARVIMTLKDFEQFQNVKYSRFATD